MKKILLLMVAVLAMQTTFAQVQIGDKIAPANVLLTYYAGGVRIAGNPYVQICETDGAYFLRFFSDNQYDQPVKLIVGEEKQYLIDLIDALEQFQNSGKNGDTLPLKSVDSKRFAATIVADAKRPQWRDLHIAALDEIVAGHMVITKGFYKKAREVLK